MKRLLILLSGFLILLPIAAAAQPSSTQAVVCYGVPLYSADNVRPVLMSNDQDRMTVTVGQALIGPTEIDIYNCEEHEPCRGHFGLWSTMLMPPLPPFVHASDGDYPDQVRIAWALDPLSPTASAGFNVYRNGTLLATVNSGVQEYQDFNVIGGQFYNYSVMAKNEFGDSNLGVDVGFVNPNGTITGNITTSNSGPVQNAEVSLSPNLGRALDFSGTTDYAEMQNISTGSAITIELWVKVLSFGTTNYTLYHFANDAGPSFYIETTAAGKIQGYWWTGASQGKVISDALTTDNWYHLALVYDFANTSAELFVNGVATDDNTLTVDPTASGTLNLGARTNGTNNFTGLLDDVRLWDTARDPADIARDMNRTLSGTEDDLTAYWKFDEGMSDLVFDQTANDHDGTLVNSPVWSADIAPVTNSGFTDEDGNYVISGIYYGSGTTFQVTPEKISPVNSYALSLDGVDDYLDVPDSLQLGGDLTIEAWVYPRSYNNWSRIIDFGNGPSSDNILLTLSSGTSGQPHFAVFYGDSYSYITSDQQIPLNTWTHVAAVLSGTTGALYLNGTSVASGTLNIPADMIRTENFIGRSNWAENGYADAIYDEIRIWDIARSQTDIQSNMNVPLNGDEDDLLAYWPMNEGNGDLTLDAALNGFHAALHNMDDTAWIKGGQVRQDVVHEFSPESRIVTLTPSNTAVDAVNFTDMTLISVSGFVRYDGTLCFEDDVDILVDGEPWTPAETTDENGAFLLEFEPGASHIIQPDHEGHTFVPPFWEVLNITSPVAGIIFKDTTPRSLRVNVYGGSPECNIPLVPGSGHLTITVTSTPACFEVSQNIDSGTWTLFENLPAYDFVVSVEHPDQRISFDGVEVSLREVEADTLNFEYHAPIVVDISGFGAYDHSDSCAVFQGPNGETLDGQPVLTQGQQVSLNFTIAEDYSPYGGMCAVDSGYVIVNNIIADAPDTTLFFSDGQINGFKFDVGEPNILSGGEHPYQKSITATAYELIRNPTSGNWVSGRSGQTTAWSFVQGYRRRGAQFVTLRSDEMPLFILRDPPGDQSYSYLEQLVGSATTRRFYYQKTDEMEYESITYISPDVYMATPMGGPIFTTDAGSNFYGDNQLIIERSGMNDLRFRIETGERFETSSAQTTYLQGHNVGDIFVGVGLNMKVTDADRLAFDAEQCALSLSTAPTVDSLSVSSGYIYSDYHIRHILCPQLYSLYETSTNPVDSLHYSFQYRRWADLLFYNSDSLKTYDDSQYIGSYSFDGAMGSFDFFETSNRSIVESHLTTATVVSGAYTQWTSVMNGIGTTRRIILTSTSTYSIPTDEVWWGGEDFISMMVAAQDVLTFLRAAMQWGTIGGSMTFLSMFTTGDTALETLTGDDDIVNASAISEVDTTITTGYHFADDDPGDYFWVNVYTDGIYGYYFETVAGASSCPWEVNTARRQNAAATIDPPIQNDVHPDEVAVFTLNLGNMTETDEAGWYLVKPLPESNPDGVVIRLNGDYDTDGFLINIPPLQVVPITMTVERGPEEYSYENLQIGLYSYCEYELALAGLNNYVPFIADTVSCAVHFKRPCSPVAISNPDDGWLLDEAANDTLWLTLQNYELNNLFSGIKLQYRPANSISGRAEITTNNDGLPTVLDVAKSHDDDVVIVTPVVELALQSLSPDAFTEEGSQEVGSSAVDEAMKFDNGQISASLRATSDDGTKSTTWINFLTIPYADLQTQFDNFGVEYIIVPWDVAVLDDGAYELRAVTTCVSTANIEGVSGELYGIIERYPPMVFGTPQPGDGILSAGDDISITFTEPIICNNIVEADMFDLNHIGLYDTWTNSLIDIDYTCYENQIIIVPNIQNSFIENHTLRLSLTGIQDLYHNAMSEQVDWEFIVDCNPLHWSGGHPDVVKYEDETLTLTRQLTNSGAVEKSFTLTDVPDWLTASPLSGQVYPNAPLTITFTLSNDLIGGAYQDTIFAHTDMGDEPLIVNMNVVCHPPEEDIDPTDYLYSMTVTGQLYEDTGGAPGNTSLYFDGQDDVIDLTAPFDIGQISHTVEMWVKVPLIGEGNLASNERVGILLGNYPRANAVNWEIMDNGRLRLFWNMGEFNLYSTTDLRDGQWRHVAFVRDKTLGRCVIYVDGQEEAQHTGTGTDIVMADAHRIGADWRGTSTPWLHGGLDEIRIWNTARSQSQIQANMDRVLFGTETGLVHYWKMDEESDNFVYDSVGGSNGVINGPARINDGAPIDHDNTTISAYVGTELRGRTTLQWVPDVNQPLFFLTLYSNVNSGEPVTLRLWDGRQCEEMGQILNAFTFESNQILGDPGSPLIFSVTTMLAQEIHLSDGWNWFSLNIDLPDMTLNSALASLNPSPNDMIKSQSQYSQYVDTLQYTGWVGTLTELDHQSTYFIQLANPGTLEQIGYPLDLTDEAIPIASGWNWIGYQPLTPMSVNNALASLNNATTGDLIKDQFSYAQYFPTTGNWIGSMTQLRPGYGYLLKMANPGTLIYPLPVTIGLDPGEIVEFEDKGQKLDGVKNGNWTVDPSAFEFNMTVTGRLDSSENAGFIGAFVGDECRGVAQSVYIESLAEKRYFLMIYSNTPDEVVTFRALGDDETEIILNEQISFEANVIRGDVMTPYVWTGEVTGVEEESGAIPTEFNLGQNFPNPFNPATTIKFAVPIDSDVEITVYNAAGQRVKSLVKGHWSPGYHAVVWNADNETHEQVPSGVYFYRMMTDSGFDKTRKLLLLNVNSG